jgi:YaiO family outer membrane protein
MRFTVVLVALLSAVPCAAAGQGTASSSEATELENAGRYEQALAAYQRLASANPNDHQARLAIARLHERLGHPDRAEAVFRSVMLEDAQNVEATLGVGRTLVEQLRPDDAVEVLVRAEQLAPENVDVLDTLGRANWDAGYTTRAIAYLERTAAISPTTQRRLTLERARLAYQHHVEVRSFGEAFTGSSPDSRNTAAAIDYRVSDRLRVAGRGEMQRKFGAKDARGGGGIEWRWTPYTTVIAQALLGPDNEIMPVGDYLGEVLYRYGRSTWMGSIRYFDFDGLSVTTVSPGLAGWITDRVWLGARFAVSLTDDAFFASTTKGYTVQLRGSYLVYPRVSIVGGYSRGVEDFDNFSLDRTGAFRAHTGLVGAQVDLPSLTSVLVNYERQSRRGGIEMQRVTISLAQRF